MGEKGGCVTGECDEVVVLLRCRSTRFRLNAFNWECHEIIHVFAYNMHLCLLHIVECFVGYDCPSFSKHGR